MTEHPCETCLRWEECNGVDGYRCNIVIADEVAGLEAAMKMLAEETENLRKALEAAEDYFADLAEEIERTEVVEREPIPRPEKNTVRKSYRKPFLPIRRQARSKLK